MGASKEKKKRLEERNSGLDIKSEEKQRSELKAAKEKRRNYIIAGVCVAVSALILFFSSNLFYRSVSVVKVGNEGYSAPEYEYFYMDMYSNYYNMYYQYYGEYAQYFMPDEETLKQDTLENMQQVTILYDEAQKVGFEAPEEMQDLIEESVDTMKEAVSESGYTSLNSYLAAYFGKGMNEKLYRSLLEKSYIASYYYEELRDSWEYTDDEIETYYSEHKNEMDTFVYYYKYFDGAAVEDDEETEEDESVSAEEAMAEAKANAEAFAQGNVLDKFRAEGDVVESYGSAISSSYAEWLYESDREEGDYTLLEVESGYYVVCFVSRDNNDYDMVNVRHILISPEAVSKDDYADDEAYQAAVEQASADAKAKAEDILQQWKDGEATEESFSELADEYSSDSPEGGLYENVYKGQMLEEFNDWIFDDRKTGDTGIVETTYGYHIIYFVGYGDNYRTETAADGLRGESYDAWLEGKKENYEVKQTIFFDFATK